MNKQKLSLTGKLLPLGKDLCEGKWKTCLCLEQVQTMAVAGEGSHGGLAFPPNLGLLPSSKESACCSPFWALSSFPSVSPSFPQTGLSGGATAHAWTPVEPPYPSPTHTFTPLCSILLQPLCPPYDQNLEGPWRLATRAPTF
jgi:hypothetical protein